jgi:D-cysteine desulfhydrase family pyridoxal phosphate-dependent enzyme
MSVSIALALEQHPRETLLRTPTPLDYLQHLSNRLATSIYLKRDDLTDLALGGDKPRKLEYELAKAREQGATVLVTCGSSQSNHARLTTAAARKLGMDCAVVLSRDQYLAFQGNLLTVYVMGAQVHWVDTNDHWDLESHAHELCNKLRAERQVPYYIPVSGTTPLSCLGYVRAGLELADQIEERELQLDAIYVPFGTGGIFTATLLALRERDIHCPLIGISVNRNVARCREHLEQWWDAICTLLDRDPSRDRGEFEIYDGFIGREYGDPTEASLDAIMLMAQGEGVLLDPVYSGKVFSGLLAHHDAGRWAPNHSILMLHSGGVPALFAYHEEIKQHLARRGIGIDA